MNYLWQIHLIYGVGLFVIGTVVGSFLNVCIYRIPWEKSVIWPGSHCGGCLTAILSRDNLPIVGWALLGGRCRNCKIPISIRYPAIELLVGILFAGVYLVDATADDADPPEYVRDDVALLVKVVFHHVIAGLVPDRDHVHRRRPDDRAGVDHQPGGPHSPRPGDRRRSRKSGPTRTRQRRSGRACGRACWGCWSAGL